MANDEHVALLKQGVAAWNAWREENPKGKRGTHEYDLRDYGLEREAVAEAFAAYTERFDIPSESS